MEVKKTNRMSLKGNNMLYFLTGLNLTLLLVLGLFSIKNAPEEIEYEESPRLVTTSEVRLFEIPQPETPLPIITEIPPSPPIPQEIETTPEPIPEPPMAIQNHVAPTIPSAPTKGPVPKGNLDTLRVIAAKAPLEGRVLDPVPVNRVKNMAVYPGCEKYRGDKRQLVRCFGEQLSKDMISNMYTKFPNVDKEIVKVKLEFLVNTDGEIIDINAVNGDDIFKPQAKKALEKAAENLIRQGKKIEPATMENESKAILIFQTTLMLQNPNY